MSGFQGRIHYPPCSKISNIPSNDPLWPWPVFPSSVTTIMAMITTITTTKTKTMEEFAAAASALRKDAEDIADLIELLIRDLLLRQAVAVDVENVSVDPEK